MNEPRFFISCFFEAAEATQKIMHARGYPKVRSLRYNVRAADTQLLIVDACVVNSQGFKVSAPAVFSVLIYCQY